MSIDSVYIRFFLRLADSAIYNGFAGKTDQ